MEPILKFLILEHENEHDLEHQEQFSEPKIYNAKGNLDKRWYVYYSFRNPTNGKLQRQKNIYGETNSFKTFEKRMYVVATYARNLLKLLEQGYNPYQDNTTLYQNLNGKTKSPVLSNNTVATELLLVSNGLVATHSVVSAFKFALTQKKKVVNVGTLSDYTSKSNHLVKWLKENEPTIISIEQLSKQHLDKYLNDLLSRTSARNRNNYRTNLSSLFQVLKDNDLIQENFIKKIPPLKSVPERNRAFTLQQQEDIFSYLERKDPLLLLYVKFVSYAFLRPIEVCRLKVKDVDVVNKRLRFEAKNSKYKTKILPQLLIDAIPDLSNFPQDNLLFTKNGIGLDWKTELTNRRNYYSKQFKKVIKDHFGFDENYGLYSFRHTYITKLYNELKKKQAPYAAKSELMLITGHKTMDALEKYLRDIDAEMPKDFSHML